MNETAARNLVRGLSGAGEPFMSRADLAAIDTGSGFVDDGRATRCPTRRKRSDAAERYVWAVLATHVVGGPARVRADLSERAARVGADELMIATLVHGYEPRQHSHDLVADAMATDRQPGSLRS